jgi:ABC-2 type transport system permease protein
MSEAAASTPRSERSFAATCLSGLTALYALAIRQHLHGKRWLVISLLFLVPAALGVLVRLTPSRIPPEGLEFMLAMMLLPQLLIPLVALLYASGIIEDELEDQTITYLLIRPLPRWAIYLVKLLATITITVALTLLFTAVTFGAIYIGSNVAGSVWIERLAKVAALHALAMTAYCCLFGLLSLLTKRALIIGVVYIAVIEGLLANLPFGIRLLTIIYYARILAYRTLSFVIATPRGEHDAADEVWQLNIADDPNLLLQPAASTCLLVLLIGSAACAAVAAAICSQREFHVKTPEKA